MDGVLRIEVTMKIPSIVYIHEQNPKPVTDLAYIGAVKSWAVVKHIVCTALEVDTMSRTRSTLGESKKLNH